MAKAASDDPKYGSVMQNDECSEDTWLKAVVITFWRLVQIIIAVVLVHLILEDTCRYHTVLASIPV